MDVTPSLRAKRSTNRDSRVVALEATHDLDTLAGDISDIVLMGNGGR